MRTLFRRHLLGGLALACASPATGLANAPAAAGEFERVCVQVVRAMKAGDHSNAERMAEAAYALANTFDPHDLRRVNVRLLRGEVARNSGKPDAAEAWYREAVQTAEAAFGPSSPELIPSLEALANLYSLTGRRDAAVPIATRLLDLADRSQPSDPIAVAGRCRNVAEAHIAANDALGAEAYYRRAVRVADSFPAGLAADRAEYMRALAEYLFHQQQLAEARELADRALKLAEQSLGGDDLGLCAPLETAGDICLATKQPDVALAYFERSVRIMERVEGKENADLARPLVRLAAAERARGDRARAKALCDRAHAVVVSGLGASATELAPVLEEQATLLDTMNQSAEASALRQRAAELRKRKAG